MNLVLCFFSLPEIEGRIKEGGGGYTGTEERPSVPKRRTRSLLESAALCGDAQRAARSIHVLCRPFHLRGDPQHEGGGGTSVHYVMGFSLKLFDAILRGHLLFGDGDDPGFDLSRAACILGFTSKYNTKKGLTR